MEKSKLVNKAITLALSQEERDYLVSCIEDKSCLNCENKDCKVSPMNRFEIDDDGNVNGYNCLAWDNKKLIEKQRVLIRNK